MQKTWLEFVKDNFTKHATFTMRHCHIFSFLKMYKFQVRCLTTNLSDTSNAWNVNFNDGHDNWNNKSNTNYVRCVREFDFLRNLTKK